MKKLALFILALMILTACDPNMQDTQDHLNKDSNKADDLFDTGHRVIERQSVIEHSNDFFVASKSFQVEPEIVLPPVFDKQLIYSSAKQEGLMSILADIYSQTGVNFKFTPDAIAHVTGSGSGSSSSGSSAAATASAAVSEQAVETGTSDVGSNRAVLADVKLSMQYKGTMREFVDRLGTQFDLYWEYDTKTKTVVYYRLRTKVLALDLLPGITSFENNLSSSSTVGGGASGANLNSGAVMTVNYKNDQGNGWLDAVNTVKAMLSNEGSVTPNMRAGFVTVSDIPERVAKIENYVNKLNDKGRKKIAVKVDVFDVVLDARTDYGIDWTAVINELGGEFTLDSGPNISPIGTKNFVDNIKFTYSGGSGFFNTVDALFRALSSIADTSKVTGTTVYTVNGEPAPVQVVKRQDYIQEITFSAVSDQSSTTQVAITPGTVISGFFMIITPTILSDSQILLNLSFSLSTADVTTNVQSVCASGQTVDCPQITLPIVNSKNFMESVTLNPGQTVVFSGFQEVDNQIGISSLAAPNWWALGGNKGAAATKTTTVTVVTPYIIGR